VKRILIIWIVFTALTGCAQFDEPMDLALQEHAAPFRPSGGTEYIARDGDGDGVGDKCDESP